MDILSLSEKLWKNRKQWKTLTHGQQNQNWDPVHQKCLSCAGLDDSKKCIRYLWVHETGLKDTLENKLIIPEEDNAISPLICPSPVILNNSYTFLIQNGSLNTITEKCVSLTDLNLDPIVFDQHTYDQCGQFVIHLLDNRTREEVRFKLCLIEILSGFHAPRSLALFFAYLNMMKFSN
ncbi:hypothetical protein JVT61DRAFT_15627 [Boletus reticuloceps]|uniref:Uncharacterized protein n=1 Tax=Boletus reticuloceps TaxID=495285 RepID=A0A8I3A245_9AGAM|nr:hypothetical protein JVT61DRAFT_15627 [Boletus reticuloceps]